MKSIDLNCDLGESYGRWTIGKDEEVMEHISSANVACGWHGGDPLVIDKTIQLAKKNNVAIGAHPSYPDLMGFGRRSMDCSREEVVNYITYQLGAMSAFCKIHKTSMTHVKPHGAMYMDCVSKEGHADAVAESIARFDNNLIFVMLAGKCGNKVAEVASKYNIKVVKEAFADRAYSPDGNIISSRKTGGIIDNIDEISERVLMMAETGMVKTIDGSYTQINPDTICVHGDSDHSINIIKAIKRDLKKASIQINNFINS